MVNKMLTANIGGEVVLFYNRIDMFIPHGLWAVLNKKNYCTGKFLWEMGGISGNRPYFPGKTRKTARQEIGNIPPEH